MGKAFFTGWAAWEKLVFCLACGIVLTVMAGCVKLVITHWRLRKYAAMAEQERKEQILHRTLSQRRSRKEMSSKDDVPFGIRAIESGIEVEGVWISRPNTPDSLDQSPSATTPTWDHIARSYDTIDLEKQGNQRRSRAISESALSASRPTSSSRDRAMPTEKTSSAQTSRESSPDAYIARPSRTQYPPCSFSKYSNAVYQSRPVPTMSASEGIEAIRRASTSMHVDMGSSDSSESDKSGNDMDSITASAPRLFNAEATPRPRHGSVDLELLNSHRVSQAAEIGQLMPRTKKTNGSFDSSTVTLPNPAVFAGEPPEYFPPRQRAPSTPSAGSSPTNPFSTPTIETLPPAVRRSSMPDVTPFTEFCQSASRSPRPEGYRSSSPDSVTRSRLPSDLSLYTSAPATPASAGPPAVPYERTSPERKTDPSPNRIQFEKRGSQVVRGHGTGFEVLRPGTFEPPTAVHPAERGQRASAPPVSLQNNQNRGRSSSAGSRKKLQKKRRPSTDSKASSDAG